MGNPESDRRRFASIARALADIETDDPADESQIGEALAAAAEFRRRHGLPPLRQDEHPEEEFYRRARALGIRRIRR